MDSALSPVLAGASPRPLGAPSPLGSEGGRRPFPSPLSGALQSPKGAPSPQGSGGGPRLHSAQAQQAGELLDAYAAVFVQKMVEAMHKTTFQQGEGFPHGGRGEQVFQGWMDQETSRKLSGALSFRKAYARTLERLDRRASGGMEQGSSGTSRTAPAGTIEESGGILS